MEVVREIVFPAPPEEVWEALTEPERLEEWFANEVELDARPGGGGLGGRRAARSRDALRAHAGAARRGHGLDGRGRRRVGRAPRRAAPPPRRLRCAFRDAGLTPGQALGNRCVRGLGGERTLSS